MIGKKTKYFYCSKDIKAFIETKILTVEYNSGFNSKLAYFSDLNSGWNTNLKHKGVIEVAVDNGNSYFFQENNISAFSIRNLKLRLDQSTDVFTEIHIADLTESNFDFKKLEDAGKIIIEKITS